MLTYIRGRRVECPSCRGAKVVTLFTSVETCGTCLGLGKIFEAYEVPVKATKEGDNG